MTQSWLAGQSCVISREVHVRPTRQHAANPILVIAGSEPPWCGSLLDMIEEGIEGLGVVREVDKAFGAKADTFCLTRGPRMLVLQSRLYHFVIGAAENPSRLPMGRFDPPEKWSQIAVTPTTMLEEWIRFELFPQAVLETCPDPSKGRGGFGWLDLKATLTSKSPRPPSDGEGLRVQSPHGHVVVAWEEDWIVFGT